MVVPFMHALYHPVSKVRLESYRVPGGSDFDMIVNYVWNMELSETLYPALQTLEVALRNGTHAAASIAYGTEFWFDRPHLLAAREARDIQKIRNDMPAAVPRTAGRIIASTTFGFWTALLNRPYEAQFWHTNNLAILKTTFPNLPRTHQNRLFVSRRCNEIRRLRNRVFHHEPIWSRPALTQEHADILEAIGWVSDEMRDLVGLCDRFLSVYQHGYADIEARIKKHLKIP